MKKLFKVLGILMLCIFGITHREKVCVVTVKCYNNLKDNMGMPFINVFLICIAILCLIVAFWYIEKLVDQKKDYIRGDFFEVHPRINIIFALDVITIIVIIASIILKNIVKGIIESLEWLTSAVSNMDVVVIVALITGTVSIVSVIISSIVSKIIDYKKNRQEYLAQKREKPYGEFVAMVYKLQKNVEGDNLYTEEMMLKDLSSFSKQITLWGSSKVVNLWVEFREKGKVQEQGNLFILEELMNEMRKDLGMKKVEKDNLLAFFVNDIKKYINK